MRRFASSEWARGPREVRAVAAGGGASEGWKEEGVGRVLHFVLGDCHEVVGS